MLELNDKLPEFNLIGDDAKNYSNESFLGKYTIMYFYPKDNTPGCTTQALSINEQIDKLNSFNVNIVGVNMDNIDTHVKFKQKNDLKYILLSDPDKLLIDLVGVWGEKRNYGKIFYGIKRTTFIFNEQGILVKTFDVTKTATHGEELVEFFAKEIFDGSKS